MPKLNGKTLISVPPSSRTTCEPVFLCEALRGLLSISSLRASNPHFLHTTWIEHKYLYLLLLVPIHMFELLFLKVLCLSECIMVGKTPIYFSAVPVVPNTMYSNRHKIGLLVRFSPDSLLSWMGLVWHRKKIRRLKKRKQKFIFIFA